MPDQTTLLAWSCVFLGAWLTGYAVYNLYTGRTRGYYQDHEYRAADNSVRFNRWVWLRLLMGIVALAAGLLAL